MPTPSAQLGLPQIAGTDSPDVPRDINAVIARFEAIRNTYATMKVGEVGDVGQIRAGRPLTIADFTGIGLSSPLFLANLTTLAGAGSNLGSAGGSLVNKGTVPNAPGIMGAAGEAAQFAGVVGQLLYISPASDAAAEAALRIRTGSIGTWFRTAKRATEQNLVSKWGVAGFQSFILGVGTTNQLQGSWSSTGSDSGSTNSTTDVADDKWHFGVITNDGVRLRVYVDTYLENLATSLPFAAVSGPLNISGRAADAGANGVAHHWGRVDEAFITADVLSEDQIRYLYCASLAHTLPVLPKRIHLGVRRIRRGGTLVTGDFPATPSRLYNFTAGAVANEGSDANGAAGTTATLLPNPGTGSILDIAGPDGSVGVAKHFTGAHTGLSATDAGLPAALTARSYGLWFKHASNTIATLMGWGTYGTAYSGIGLRGSSTNVISAFNAADFADGPRTDDTIWHQATVVEDNTGVDYKRKFYIDGRFVAGSTVMNAITLAGANRFRVGAAPDGTSPFTGTIARPFVYSGALTAEQVRAIYNKGIQTLPVNPSSESEHVEAFEPVRALVVFDSLEATDLVDLAVAAA